MGEFCYLRYHCHVFRRKFNSVNKRLIPFSDQYSNNAGQILLARYGCRAQPSLHIIFRLKEKWNY